MRVKALYGLVLWAWGGILSGSAITAVLVDDHLRLANYLLMLSAAIWIVAVTLLIRQERKASAEPPVGVGLLGMLRKSTLEDLARHNMVIVPADQYAIEQEMVRRFKERGL